MRKVVRKPIMVSASVSCMNLMNMAADLEAVHASDVSFLHFDVVDGVFNNCFILGSPTLEALRKHTELPIEVHLAVMKPENFLAQYIDAGADYIAFHLETQPPEEALRLCGRVRELGALPILALRAETLLDAAHAPLLREVDWALKLMVQPGYAGQKIGSGAMAALAQNAAVIREHVPGTGLQADGNVNLKTIPDMIRAGANILTGGTSGLFSAAGVAANARAMLACAVLEKASSFSTECDTKQ